MGRLDHLKESLPAFPRPCVVVDYSCPDNSGDWASRQPGVTVVKVPDQTFFHKSRALNLGAAKALEMGAEALAFLDADTLVKPGFVTKAQAKAKTCWIAASGNNQLVGVLVVTREDYLASKGFDEAYRGWGVEDLDMRLRLNLLAKCSFERLPAEVLSSIPHSDALRTKNYTVKSPWVSRALNAMILEGNIRHWTGGGPMDLSDEAKSLMKV